MNGCRAITAIKGNIKQISKFYEDLIILDNSIGFEYDEDFQEIGVFDIYEDFDLRR